MCEREGRRPSRISAYNLCMERNINRMATSSVWELFVTPPFDSSSITWNLGVERFQKGGASRSRLSVWTCKNGCLTQSIGGHVNFHFDTVHVCNYPSTHLLHVSTTWRLRLLINSYGVLSALFSTIPWSVTHVCGSLFECWFQSAIKLANKRHSFLPVHQNK